MFYTQADRTQAKETLRRRRFVVFIPAAAMLLVAVASFLWFRMHRDASGWWVSGLITVIGGAYALFLGDVYLKPVRLYKRHVDLMLDGRKRETVGVLVSVDPVVRDRDGLDCVAFTLNTGDRNLPEDERVFDLDALKSMPDIAPGTRLRVLSNDRMVAGLQIEPKET